MKKIILFFILSSSFILNAQFLNKEPNEVWKKYRREIFFGGGGTQFLSDLGGNGAGHKFGLGDINWRSTKYEIHLGYRYQINPLLSTTSILYFGLLKGNDKISSNYKNRQRNIEVITLIIEFSQRAELILYSKYQKKAKKSSNLAWNRMQVYTFLGIGMFYYNPEGKRPDGSWVALQPLKTEGQGYPGRSAKSYKRFSVNIPFGLGFQKSFTKRRSVKMELTYNKTFTDYLDDTSGKYYDYSSQNQMPPRPDAIYFADPTGDYGDIELELGEYKGDFKHGAERGGKGKDCYFYASFSFVKALGLRKELKKEKNENKNARKALKNSKSIL